MRTFVKQLFSESGAASFGRTASFLSLLAAIAWVTQIVWTTRQLPNLEGLTLFIATFYGLGKAGETVARFANRTPPEAALGRKPEGTI